MSFELSALTLAHALKEGTGSWPIKQKFSK